MRRLLVAAGVAALLVAGFFVFRHQGNTLAEGGVDQALVKLLPPGYSATHGNTSYDALTGDVTIHDFTLSRHGVALGSASHVVASGLDQNALRDVFDPASYPDGKPAWTDRRKLIGHLEADDVVISAQDPGMQPAHIKRVSLDQLVGRPFAMAPTRENLGQSALQADIALALSVKKAVAEDAGVAKTANDADHVELGSFTVSGYDRGKLDSIDLKDVVLHATDTTKTHKSFVFTLADLGLTGLDAGTALALSQGGSHDQQAKLGGVKLAGADLSKFQVAVAGGPLFGIGSAHIGYEEEGGGVTRSTLVSKDWIVAMHETPRTGDLSTMIQAFGADQVVFDVNLDGKMDQAAHTMRFDHYDWVFHDLGTLHMAADVTGFPGRDQLKGAVTPAEKLAVLNQTRIGHAVMSWEDHSLVNRIIAVAAKKSGSTPDVIRGQMAMPLVTLGMMMPDQPDAAEQVTAFINNPQSLTITVNPPAPVSFAEIGAAPLSGRAHLLGLKIEGK